MCVSEMLKHNNPAPQLTEEYIIAHNGEITIDAPYTEIPCNFCNNSFALTTVYIGENIRLIRQNAFQNCVNLKNVIFKDRSVSMIEENVFDGCHSVETINLPSTILSLPPVPFKNMDKLNSIVVSEENIAYISQNGVLYDKEMKNLIKYPPAKTDLQFYLPKSVINIGSFAFEKTIYLNKIITNENLQCIKNNAFRSSSATLITFPKTSKLKQLGMRCFSDSHLHAISLPASLLEIKENAFALCFFLETIYINGFPLIRRCAISDDYNLHTLSMNEMPKNSDFIVNCPNLKTVKIGKETFLSEIIT